MRTKAIAPKASPLAPWMVRENELSGKWIVLGGIPVCRSVRRVDGVKVTILRMASGKAWTLAPCEIRPSGLEALHVAGLGGNQVDVYVAPSDSPLALKLSEGNPLAEPGSTMAVVALCDDATCWRIVRARKLDRAPYKPRDESLAY